MKRKKQIILLLFSSLMSTNVWSDDIKEHGKSVPQLNIEKAILNQAGTIQIRMTPIIKFDAYWNITVFCIPNFLDTGQDWLYIHLGGEGNTRLDPSTKTCKKLKKHLHDKYIKGLPKAFKLKEKNEDTSLNYPPPSP